MQVDDMIILSIDDHTIEPPNVFDGRVPAKYADDAPRLVRDAEGKDRWVFEGKEVATSGLNATVGWPKDEWDKNPSSIAEMRPAAYLVDERVRDMNRNGILASMCFPSMPGFSGGRFYSADDKDLASVVLRAYNDWHIEEWCGSHPGRFIPLAIVQGWDPEQAAREIERVAAQGARAICLPELPHLAGLPTYASDYWNPIWRAVSDEDVVVCLHIGQGLDAIDMGPSFSIDNYIVMSTQISALCTQDLIWGPAMRSFPELKFAFSEGGIGWIPFLLDRIDRHYENQVWTHQDFGDKLPSEVFREHSLACFISDPTSLKLYRDIGPELIAFEVDYPHSDSVWPTAPEFLLAQCEVAGMSDDEIDLVAWRNAARFCSYDPFVHVRKEQATVAALRALSPDVDTASVSRLEYRARFEANPSFESRVDLTRKGPRPHVPTFDSFDGVTLSYTDQGDGSPVVLLHGFAANAHVNFVRSGVVDLLRDDGHRVIALDTRGHGLSEAPTDIGAYADDAVRKDVAALLDHLGLDEARFVGYSMGGDIALPRFAAHDQRVSALVVIGVGTAQDEVPDAEREQFMSALAAPDHQSTPVGKFHLMAELNRAALLAHLTAEGAGFERRPGAIDVPVLMIVGDDDAVAGDPEPLAARYAAPLVRPPGNHFNAHATDEAHQALHAFLREHSRGRARRQMEGPS